MHKSKADFRRFFSARKTLAGLLSVLCLSSLTQAGAAAYATGGAGKYKSDILWLTWGGGTNGTKGQPLIEGASTSANMTVNGKNMIVTCTLSGITAVSGSGGLQSYAPGGWKDDGLDNLYNIGGMDGSNTLVSGIITNNKAGSAYRFHVTCISTLDGQPYAVPGLVVADAESMAGGEYLQASANGSWRVMEHLTCNSNVYNAELSSNSQTIKFSTTAAGDCTSVNESGAASNAMALAFLTFNPGAYSGSNLQLGFDVELKGNGLTAVALGLLTPNLDSSDAPSTYGQAVHLFAPNLSADGLTSGQTTNIGTTAFQVSSLISPTTNLLGSLEDADGLGFAGAAGATTDDTTNLNDEDSVQVSNLAALNAKTTGTYTVPVRCSGTGMVKGWIDFNINGTFDSGESAQTACTGNGATVNLNFTVPGTIKIGQSYLRVRYAVDATQLASPFGIATTGEVEDYALPIYGRLVLNKTWGQALSGDSVTLSISGGGLSSPQTKNVTAPIADSTSAFIISGSSVTVSETGSRVANYTQALQCQKVSDSSVVVSGAVATATFNMPSDSDVTCTLTNALRVPIVPPLKKYVRVLPSGTFGLKAQALPGTLTQYCIVFQNTGNAPAQNFVLTDAFPANTSAAYPAMTTDNTRWNLRYSASGADLLNASSAPASAALPSGVSLTVGTVNSTTGARGVILNFGAAGLAAGSTGTVCFDTKIN